MDVGTKIKELRKMQKLTQVDLAKKASISRSYLADIERNRYNPSVETLSNLSKGLGLTLSQLVDENKSDIKIETKRNYFIEQYLQNLGYEIIYDPEGYLILNTTDAEYEISENDIIDLQKSADSFIKFKISEITSKCRKSYKNNREPEIEILAAHNDNIRDDANARNIEKIKAKYKEMHNK